MAALRGTFATLTLTFATLMCLYPIYIRNKKYSPNKKNGYIAPILHDQRVGYVAVGCGICEECRKKRANEWKMRLNEEIKWNKENAVFVTLTLSEEYYDKLHADSGNVTDEHMLTFAIRRFKERIRKTYGKMPKMWLIQEYGEDYDRVHLHGLIWGMDSKSIEKHWKYGFVYNGNYTNAKTVNYIVKYCLKTDAKRPNWKPKIWCSPGLGSAYNTNFNTFNNEKTNELYRTPNGAKIGLPIYYRNKIYTEKQREYLWIKKLEKEERFILGDRYSVRTNKLLNSFKRALKNAQEANERKNYGSIANYWTNNKANTINLNQCFENSEKCCNFAMLNTNNQQPWNDDKSKIQLENRRLQKTKTNGYLLQNPGHGRYHENRKRTHDDLGNGCGGNEIQKRIRLHRTDTNMETGRTEEATNNNINTYNESVGTNNAEKQLAQGGGNMSQGSRNVGKTLPNTKNGMLQENERKSIEMLGNSNRTGYEIVDIDTGEIYTRQEYTIIKNQLKTIKYEKRKKIERKPDGSKRTVWQTKRFVKQIGSKQHALF